MTMPPSALTVIRARSNICPDFLIIDGREIPTRVARDAVYAVYGEYKSWFFSGSEYGAEILAAVDRK